MSDQTRLALDSHAQYRCSITGLIMKEPVFTADGHTYEKEAIEKWFMEHDTSPKTMEKLANKQLTTNWDKISAIDLYLSSYPEAIKDVYLPKAWLQELIAAIKSNNQTSVAALLAKEPRLLTAILEVEKPSGSEQKDGSMINEADKEQRGYIQHETLGDGECGYTACGITRAEAFRLLSAKVEVGDAQVMGLIKLPIKGALVTREFYDYLQTVKAVSEDVSFDMICANIENFASNAAIAAAYLQYDIVAKKISLGWAHPGILQALAHIRGLRIRIWCLREDQALVPHTVDDEDYSCYVPANYTGTIDICFINGHHFDKLELINCDAISDDTPIYPLSLKDKKTETSAACAAAAVEPAPPIEETKTTQAAQTAPISTPAAASKSLTGYTAFHLALECESSSPELADFIFEKLFNADQLRTILVQPENFNPFHLHKLFLKAMINKKFRKCDWLFELKAFGQLEEFIDTNSLLRKFAKAEDDDEQPINWLLSKEQAVIDSIDKNGNTPLMRSVLHDRAKIIKRLLEAGANRHVVNKQNQSPILLALLQQKKPILSLFFGNKATIVDGKMAMPHNLPPAVHLALEHGGAILLKSLLDQKTVPINVDELDEHNHTVLYTAIFTGNQEVVSILLANGANPTIHCGATMETPLHVAIERGNIEILKMLLANEIVLKNINVVNADGNTALHLAVQRNRFIPLLLQAGANHRAKNRQGQNPIDLAKQQGTAEELQHARQKQIEDALAAAKAEIDRLRQEAREQKAREEGQQAASKPVAMETLISQTATTASQQKFLSLVATGLHDKAEKMLSINQSLAFARGTITDGAGRLCTDITGLEFAVLNLDWNVMRAILRNCSAPESVSVNLTQTVKLAAASPNR